MLLRRPRALPAEERVRRANRLIYNEVEVAAYEGNESIFNAAQERRLRGILEELRRATGGARFLDVGCGTGNLLRLAREVFPRVIGVDQAERLLARVARRDASAILAAAQADRLPFPDASFDVVGMYALLHHMVDPGPALGEAYRVLRPGGILYTDHDPNYLFGRFYHLLYRLRHRNGRHGFGSELGDLAEVHHVFTGGLDPRRLAAHLRQLGFRDVEVRYRQPSRAGFTGARRAALALLSGLTRVAPLRSLYTHFLLRARK